MKKIIVFLCVIVCTASAIYARSPSKDTMYVSVERVEVKAKTGAFAKVLGTLSYGEAVHVAETSGKWVCVTSAVQGNVTGWIPLAALTSKKIKNSAAAANASAKELALAGKGFTQEIEDSYKQGNNQSNYDAVDEMESRITDTTQLAGFIKDGKLTAGE